MEIRKTDQNDDFGAIGNIYASSWEVAYRGIVPQSYLDGLSGSSWSAVLKNSEYNAFVVMENGKYIGTSSICAARDEAMAEWGEIISIYLLPEYWGQGYAQPLFDHAIDALRNAGFQDIYLWVLKGNARAQRFYEKNGFHHNGDVSNITIAGKELEEVRYVKHLQPR